MEEMKSSFGIKITFLDHYKITKAIPNIWLETIEYKVTCPYSVRRPIALKYLLKNKKGCSELCKILNHSNDVIAIKAEKKWISDLNLEGSLCNWNVIYKMPFVLTTNSNLRYFQYRLCHRILTTNKFLHLIIRCKIIIAVLSVKKMWRIYFIYSVNVSM
jgi:hypothetical protein